MSPAGRAGSAREEAERLVATVLAAAAMAARSGGYGAGPGSLGSAGPGGLWSAIGLAQRVLANPDLATGEPACCVCPLCRLISAMRDPSPEFAERLATGAGDVATGIAGIMRAFGEAGRGGAGDGGPPWASGAAEDEARSAPAEDGSDAWHVASEGGPDTRRTASGTGPDAGRDEDSGPDRDVWRSATRAAGGAMASPQASGHATDDAREAAAPPGEVR